MLLLQLILILSTAPFHARGASLMSMLQASNLTTFTSLLESTGLGVQMNSNACNNYICFLVFAPTNAAFASAYPNGVLNETLATQKSLVNSLYTSSYLSGTKGLLSTWPSAGTPLGVDVGFGQVQILSTSKAQLYWLGKQSGSAWTYHVNNARVNVTLSNQEGDNGVYHVLDQVPLPVGTQMSLQVFFSSGTDLQAQLGVTKSVALFNEWMNSDTAKNYVYNLFLQDSVFKVRTVFLPSDSAWDSLSSNASVALNASLSARRQLLSAHFALNYTLFTRWLLEVDSIGFTAGNVELNQLSAKMYVDANYQGFVTSGGVVAQLVNGSVNFPLTNAIIHVIDRPLGFLYQTLATLAKEHAPDFYAKCLTVSSCSSMLQSATANYTLFAPQYTYSLSNATASELEAILKLHFIPYQRISRPEMTESALLESSYSAGQIRFRQYNGGLAVEGRLSGRGFVRSMLVSANEPATNGLFHRIKEPLGQPNMNVQEFINDYSPLSNVSAYVGSDSFDPALSSTSKQFTVFAATNSALRQLRLLADSGGNNVGAQILRVDTLRDRVLRRLILPNQRVFIGGLSAGTRQYATANTVENEEVTLSVAGSIGLTGRNVSLIASSVTVAVNLSYGQYECTNGVVYPIDLVPAQVSDVEGYPSDSNAVGASFGCVLFAAALSGFLWLRQL